MASRMTQNNRQNLTDVSGATNIELTSDGGYYSTSPSQLMYPTTSPSLHTTPNTPTSIPDITLTGKLYLYKILSSLCFFLRQTTTFILDDSIKPSFS